MSTPLPIEELISQQQEPVGTVVGASTRRRILDWPVLVVALALGCTLAWACFLIWLAVQAVQIALA